MFGWGKRKAVEENSASGREGGSPVIAAVLMEGATYPIEQLRGKVEQSTFRGIAPGELTLKKDILVFKLKDEMAAVAPMGAPYPWSDLEGPCETSWMWPKDKPATTLKAHKNHVLVTLFGGKRDAIERRLTLTQLTAMVASAPGVMGVFWPEATVAHFPPVFLKMAEKVKSPEMQMYLWVDFRVVRNEDGSFGLFTTGLAPLGSMELEIPRILMKPGELREWGIQIAVYLLKNGTRVKDGDTLGPTADQRFRVRHKASLWKRPGKVIRLES